MATTISAPETALAQDYDALLALDHAHLLHPQHHPADHAEALIFDRGEGAVLWDVRGRRYLDGLSCLWNVNVGHGRTELADAGAAQMRRLAFVNSYVGSSNAPAITLAARLARMTPGTHLNTTFFTTGGAESSDTAFKTVRRYWALRGQPDRVKIISRTNGYHGTTIGATAATGLPAFHPNWGPPAPGFVIVPPMDIDAIEAAILADGPETVAAVIAEPVQGSGGVYPPPADYFPRLRALCDTYDILLIADEVITGFGRTGTVWGLDQWGVVPDVISFAKGITSGYQPLGGIIISDAIRDVIYDQPSAQRWWHAYTYSAHATGCAVAHANLDVIENEGLVVRAGALGARLNAGLAPLAGHPAVREVRGLGLMASVEFTAGAVTGGGGAVAKAMRDRGLFTRYRNDTVMFAPPFVTTDAELDELLGIAHDAIRSVTGE
ncbi:MAG: aspartate aminotransferase family protein [Chloroflexota bacterium]